jgi:hypothetical protein
VNTAEAITVIAIALIGAWIVISAVSRGAISGEENYTVVRAERPLRFWIEVAIGVIITSACIVFAVYKLAKP